MHRRSRKRDCAGNVSTPGCLLFTGGRFCLRFCLHKLSLPCGASSRIKQLCEYLSVLKALLSEHTHRQHLAPNGCRTEKQKAALLEARRTPPPPRPSLSEEGRTGLVSCPPAVPVPATHQLIRPSSRPSAPSSTRCYVSSVRGRGSSFILF